MKQTAQVIRYVAPGYAEVKVRRTSACASAHNCGSCDHCSMLANAPEIIVVAENPKGAEVGETVTVESSTAGVMKAAMVLYIVPLLLFFAGYIVGNLLGWTEGPAIALGGGGFVAGILMAMALDRHIKNNRPMQFKIVSIEG